MLLGLVYGTFTNWGFFKHRWLTVKWILFIAQTLAGIFIIDKLMVINMVLLETQKSTALTNPVFAYNHQLRQIVVFIQIAVTISMIAISVFKPWKSKRSLRSQ